MFFLHVQLNILNEKIYPKIVTFNYKQYFIEDLQLQIKLQVWFM